jgi:hypothetical protein
MPHAHVHLLLDINKAEGELWAECPSCGSITFETLETAWSKRFIACECGLIIEVVAEHLRQLRAMATDYQRRIDELIGQN